MLEPAFLCSSQDRCIRGKNIIAHAIAQKTPVVLMDEPTTYLDVCSQVKILNVIREINREDGVTFAIELHDPNHALSPADHVVLVSGGSAVLERTGTAMTVENMDRLYGVRTAFTEAFGARCLEHRLPGMNKRVA